MPKPSTMPAAINMVYHRLPKLVMAMSACSLLWLAGCDSNTEVTKTERIDTASSAETDLSVFAGCYTVSHDEPAQIKVSEQDGAWVMQMKEPASSGRVWDAPEPLEVLDKAQIPKFFSIDPNNVDAVIARPDRVLVLAHIKPVYANIDPLLDSEYLSYIYKGANTIYQVECDEINTDILADPHANIAIDTEDGNNTEVL